MAKRLKETHPTFRKVQQVFDLMDQLGITIEFNGYHTVVADKNLDAEMQLKDADSGEVLTFVPPFMEYKLIIED